MFPDKFPVQPLLDFLTYDDTIDLIYANNKNIKLFSSKLLIKIVKNKYIKEKLPIIHTLIDNSIELAIYVYTIAIKQNIPPENVEHPLTGIGFFEMKNIDEILENMTLHQKYRTLMNIKRNICQYILTNSSLQDLGEMEFHYRCILRDQNTYQSERIQFMRLYRGINGGLCFGWFRKFENYLNRQYNIKPKNNTYINKKSYYLFKEYIQSRFHYLINSWAISRRIICLQSHIRQKLVNKN